MNTSEVKSGFPSTGKYLMGGFVLAACATWFALRKKGKKAPAEILLTEAEVYDILREFRKSFFPLLRSVSRQSAELQRSIYQRLGGQPPNMKDILMMRFMDENEGIAPEVEQIELGILARYNIADPDSFKAACLSWAKKSPRIAEIMRDIKNQFEGAVTGRMPVPTVPFPTSISVDAIKEHFLHMTKNTSKKLLEASAKFRETHGMEGMRTPEYSRVISKIASSEDPNQYQHLYPTDLQKDYHIQQLFSMGVNHYRQKDAQFAKAMEQLTDKQDQLFQNMHQPIFDFDRLHQEIEGWTLAHEKEGFYLDVVEGDEGEGEGEWQTHKDEASQTVSNPGEKAEDDHHVHDDHDHDHQHQHPEPSKPAEENKEHPVEAEKKPETETHPEATSEPKDAHHSDHLEVPDDAKSHKSTSSKKSKKRRNSRKNSQVSQDAAPEPSTSHEAAVHQPDSHQN